MINAGGWNDDALWKNMDFGNVQAWYDDTIYNKGDQVIHNGITYTAKWWTRGEAPGKAHGAWK